MLLYNIIKIYITIVMFDEDEHCNTFDCNNSRYNQNTHNIIKYCGFFSLLRLKKKHYYFKFFLV